MIDNCEICEEDMNNETWLAQDNEKLVCYDCWLEGFNS